MTSRKITIRAIFNEAGEPIHFLYQNGGSKSYLMDCEPSKDSSIDELFMELLPPQDNVAISGSSSLTPQLPPDSTLV